MAVDETKLINTIVISTDWQEVLSNLIVEQEMDPLSIDLVRLSDAFMGYLTKLRYFDFRIPARFVLIAAILLRMKCELILEKEEEERVKEEEIPPINIDNIPELAAPIIRRPTRKVTFDELVRALAKAFEFEEHKETKKIRMRRAIETLIEPEEDIEERIKNIYHEIARASEIKFSQLVPEWKRVEIVRMLMPVLHLSNRDKVTCDQQEMFGEITIKIREMI